MDPIQPRRSLVDDPEFLASLEGLDSGLPHEAADADEVVVAMPPRRSPSPPPAPPPASPPPPAPTLGPETVVADAASPVAMQAPTAQTRRRPLLELFPPAPLDRVAAPPAARRVVSPSAQHRAPAPGGSGRDALTYEMFYGLREKPFSLSSDPKFLYHSASHDLVAQELLSAIRRREGLVLLTGAPGTGKTTLCRAVVDQLDRRTLTSFVLDPFVTVEDFLRTLLADFGVVSRDDIVRGRLTDTSRQNLVGALRAFLASLATLDAFAVVIVDEAQNLSPDLLEQIRVVTDVEEGPQLLQVVLVGQPGLETLLRRSELQQMNQRISVRCELHPIGGDEILGYVLHRMAVAGSDGRVEFDDAAIARIHEWSGGVPRLINLLCDRALTLGFDASASVIEEPLVEQAARDLDLELPSESEPSRATRFALGIVILLILMLTGASAAAVVFHDQFALAIQRWQSIPPAPARPPDRRAPPLGPLPLPAEASGTPVLMPRPVAPATPPGI